ncbi:hypothetical protein GCM10009616_16830 [Microlunatus lacustris]
MQTLVAFALDPGASRPGRAVEGRGRVETWYAASWGTAPRSHQAVHAHLGLVLWADPADQSRWPAWVQGGSTTVATLHSPLGHERLVGGVERAEAPLALAAHLRRDPGGGSRLTPAWVLAELDAAAARLTLSTDGLGLGRLHEVRTAEGIFWSNRPVAALRFAGVRAEPDVEAWRRMAACDWAMGDRTPYQGVTVVPAGTQVNADAHGVRREGQDVLNGLRSRRRDPLTSASLAVTADALAETADAVAATWPGTPVISLSGGRDSRLVVAAFLAAGRPVRLKTYGTAGGEADTARRLVDLLPHPVAHEVSTPAAERPHPQRAGALTRARRWHDVTEGLRPSIYLRSNAPKRLLRHDPPLICGVGGEFGHAPGYPDDVERLEGLPLQRRLDGFARALEAKITIPRGLAPHAREAANQQIRAVLHHAAGRGVSDAKALDWFYADERLRRWGMAGESAGRVMPLLVSEFVSAAFGLTTSQSRASALHGALIERLVPAWTDVPYYSATLGQRQRVRQQRLWEESDADLLDELVQQPDDWGDAFDVPRVQSVWSRARAGQAAPRDELLLQRVVWRAAFTDHLLAVNAGTAPVRPRVALQGTRPDPAPAPTSRPRRSPVVLLATWANDVPLARRLARTSLGRRVRRQLGA